MDCSLPGSSVHGIFQARVLEWVAFPFSKGSSNPGTEPRSPALQVDSLPAEPQGKTLLTSQANIQDRSEKTPENPLDSKEIKPVYYKENQPWTLEGLMLKLRLHLMWRANSLEKILMLGKIEGRRRWGWQRISWLDGITDSMDMSLSKLQETVKNREAWCASAHGIVKSWTLFSDWTTTSYQNPGKPLSKWKREIRIDVNTQIDEMLNSSNKDGKLPS